MLNNLNKLQLIAQHENAPGIEGWFQWELVTSSHVPPNWDIIKGRSADLIITYSSSKPPKDIELKGVTGKDFNGIVKKWYYDEQNQIIKKRKDIPILFLSRMHQEKQIKKLQKNLNFLCDYQLIGTKWIVGICKPV